MLQLRSQVFPTALLLVAAALSPAFAQVVTPATQPCSYFPESLVRSAFSIPASEPLQRTEKRACRWEYAGKPGAGSGPVLQGVGLNFYTGKFAPNRIDQLFDRMKNGSTNTVNGRQIVIKPKDVEWVAGVGDKAFWNNDLNQLAVSAKKQLFYVTVTIDGVAKAEKVEASKKAAAGVIGKL